MKRFAIVFIVALVGILMCGISAFAGIDLSTSSHSFDIAAGAYDTTVISFYYNYGSTAVHTPAFRIRRLNDDGTDSWLGSFNIHTSSFNLDTSYGPYSCPNVSLLDGTAYYEFTLNRSNGLWDLAVNGTAVDFYPILTGDQVTNNPQPDGSGVAEGVVIPNKYFSDQSLASGQNAVALGWATWNDPPTSLSGNAVAGVGGTGAYRILFLPAAGGSVDNFAAANVPEPATLLIWTFLGLLGAVAYGRRK